VLSRSVLLLGGGLAAAIAAPAAAGQVDLTDNSAEGLERACRRAGEGGTVRLSRGFVVDRTIRIETPGLTIVGNGAELSEGDAAGDLLRLLADGVTLDGLAFRGRPEGAFRAMVVPAAGRLTIRNCVFRGGSGGIRQLGEFPRGLRVQENLFEGVPTAIAWNRDVLRMEGDDRVRRALEGGGFLIEGNRVRDASIAGITIDAGNDGGTATPTPAEGNGDPGFPGSTDPLRYAVRGRTTAFDTDGGQRSQIRGNRIENAGGFGIALARVSGIDVVGNEISVARDGKAFRRGIHLENRAHTVDVRGNTVVLQGGTGQPSAYGMVNFTDYGNPASFANGVRRTRFHENVARGEGRAFVGSGFAGIVFTGNRSLGDIKPYGFHSAPGGENHFVRSAGNHPDNP